MALWLFCRRITVSDKTVLNTEGPLLLASNHPNSFLDAVIIGSLFKKPVHFLARGDAFRKPWIAKLLIALKLIPIYRLSEGREYLALNDVAFEQCYCILQQGGIVLIFAEGLCKNDWHLRPLKKGAARIAISAWKNESLRESLQIIPVGISYNSFNFFGKKLLLHFAKPITPKDLPALSTEGESINCFNDLLFARLKESIVQVEHEHTNAVEFLMNNYLESGVNEVEIIKVLQSKLEVASRFTFYKKIQKPYFILKNNRHIFGQVFLLVFTLPLIIFSCLLHLPLYVGLKTFANKKTKGTVFYDSVLFVLLLLFYPLWWLICIVCSSILAKTSFLIPAFCMPLLAWLHIWWKQALASCRNYLMLSKKEKKEISNLLFL